MFSDVRSQASPLANDKRVAYYVRAASGEEPSEPLCDGRGILILGTVRMWSGFVREMLAQELAKSPRAEFTYPGQCASLREREREGDDPLYPVYIDFGHDYDALCAAAPEYLNSMPRLLTNEDEYVTPCSA